MRVKRHQAVFGGGIQGLARPRTSCVIIAVRDKGHLLAIRHGLLGVGEACKELQPTMYACERKLRTRPPYAVCIPSCLRLLARDVPAALDFDCGHCKAFLKNP